MDELRELPAESVLMVGYSAGLMRRLDRVLGVDAVVVVEEPDVVARRRLHEVPLHVASVARVLPVRYQLAYHMNALLDRLVSNPPRAVLTGVEYGVVAAARATERFGLPGVGVEAATIFRDKHRLRALAGRAGLRNPRYALVGSGDEAAAFVQAVGKPCVVKPTARHASLGVRLVTDADSATDAWAAAVSPAEALLVPDRGIPSGVLVEEAVAGPEFSVELLLRDGVVLFSNVTTKHVNAGDFPVEIGHDVPAQVPNSVRRLLVETNTVLAAAAGFSTGVLHGEWILHEGAPVLIECAARMPGDDLCALIDSAYGFDCAQTYLRLLLGLAVSCPDGSVGAAAIRFFTPPSGVVTAVTGALEARSLPFVTDVQVDVVAGDRTSPIRSSWDRAGHVIAEAPTVAEAKESAERALRMVKIRTA